MELKLSDLAPSPLARPLPETSLATREEHALMGPSSPKATAFDLYILEHKCPAEIAAELKLSLPTVVRWFSTGRWVSRRREQDQTVIDAANHKAAVIKATERVAIMTEQLIMGKAIENVVSKAMEAMEDRTPTPKEAKDLADAALSSTVLRTRLVGISDKIAQEAQGSKPQALLIIGAPPPQPAGTRPIETIDVEANEA